jgi:hypothetical protein
MQRIDRPHVNCERLSPISNHLLAPHTYQPTSFSGCHRSAMFYQTSRRSADCKRHSPISYHLSAQQRLIVYREDSDHYELCSKLTDERCIGSCLCFYFFIQAQATSAKKSRFKFAIGQSSRRPTLSPITQHHSCQYCCRSLIPSKEETTIEPLPSSSSRILSPEKDVTRTRLSSNGFSRYALNSDST